MGSKQSLATGSLHDRSHLNSSSHHSHNSRCSERKPSSNSHHERSYERKSSSASNRSRSYLRKSSSSSIRSRSSERKSSGGLRHKKAGRIPLATNSEKRVKRYIKEAFQLTSCPETLAQTTRVSLNLMEQTLDLEDPFVLATLARYFAKYSNTSDIELGFLASSSEANLGGGEAMGGADFSVSRRNGKNIDFQISLPGLVALLKSSAVLRLNMTSLHIGQGCALKGNLISLFRDVLPFFPNLRNLHLESLRASTSVAALIFSSWRHRSSLESVYLNSLHGNFEELFDAMGKNHANLPSLKDLTLSNMYICEAGVVVQAAAKYLGSTKTLQNLHLSFVDEFECSLDSLANGILENGQQSQFCSLSVRDVKSQCFPVKSQRELDLFLESTKVCPSLQELGLRISPALIEAHTTVPTNPLPTNVRQARRDAKQREAIVQTKIDELNFRLRLNQHQAIVQLLNQETKPCLEKWATAVIEAKDDTAVIYHYLSHDPSWIGEAASSIARDRI